MKPDRQAKRSSRQKVILLVRDTQRFSEALHIGQALVDAGASVILVCLGRAVRDPEEQGRFKENATLAGPSGTGLSIMWCRAGHPAPARADLPAISLGRLTEKLRTADLIVPF